MTCRLCHGRDLKLFYTQGDDNQFHFHRCRKCGLVNLDLEGLNHLQNQEKYALEFPDPFDQQINRGSFASYEFLKKRIREPGRFLDVGCGNGALLQRAHEDGWEVHGLELSGYLAEQVTSRLGIQVDVADFLSYELPGERFDLVSLRHVLEHLPDSVAAMKGINRLLKTGGRALLEFPNIDGISFKTRRMLGRTGLHTKRYGRDYQPGHCNEFGKRPFEFLLGKTEFRLEVWETYSHSPAKNLLYNRFPIGTKARALIRKIADA